MPAATGFRAVLGVGLVACLAMSGCVRYDDRDASPFTPVPPAGMGPAPGPAPPPEPGPAPPPETDEEGAEAPEGPCVDSDPAVIATCLEPTRALVGLEDSVLAGDESGRVVLAAPGREPEDYARVDTGGGRLVALALSPAFEEDRLVFALVVGDGDGKVMRFSRGQNAAEVATVGGGRSGGLAFVDDELVVGAGDELFRFDYDGVGDPGRPRVTPAGGTVSGVCTDGEELFTTVDSPAGPALRTGDAVAWTWPGEQEIGGCAAAPDGVAIGLPSALRVDLLPLVGGLPGGAPMEVAEDEYGRLAATAVLTGGMIVGSTINKDGGEPVDTDDRVVVLDVPIGGASDSRT